MHEAWLRMHAYTGVYKVILMHACMHGYWGSMVGWLCYTGDEESYWGRGCVMGTRMVYMHGYTGVEGA